MSNAKMTIKVPEVLALLKKGYTRYKKDDAGYGNLQDHYGLTGVQIKELFNHPKLKARKTILPKETLNIVDEDETMEVVEAEPAEPTPLQDDVTGLEIAKVVTEELERLLEPKVSEVKVEEVVNREQLFS